MARQEHLEALISWMAERECFRDSESLQKSFGPCKPEEVDGKSRNTCQACWARHIMNMPKVK